MGRSARVWAILAVVGTLVGMAAVAPASAVDEEWARGSREAVSVGSLAGLSETVGKVRQQFRSETMSLSSAASEGCIDVGGDEALTVLRYAGSNRYQTAVCVSLTAWPDHDDPDASEFTANAVVLARGDLFPDALAGGPLAAYAEGPLLLTQPTALTPVTAAEIDRVLAPGGLVYLLGGTSAISAGIEQQLKADGYQTKRLAGSNRFSTSLAIADELPDTSNFFFATGLNFPDALAAGNAAAALTLGAKFDTDPETRPFAVLLTADDQMPAAVADFVWDRGDQFGVWTLLTAGGQADTAAVAEFGTVNVPAENRYVGANRFGTATLIAEDIFTDTSGVLVGDGVGLATGLNFPDALAASAYLAWFGNPLVLTASTLTAPTSNFLTAHAGEGEFLEAFGGTVAISQPVLDAAEAAFRP